MYAAFVKLLNMSAAAGILIAAVIVLRFLFRKTPRKYICILWALAAFRLVCPFSISSNLSAYNYIGNAAQDSGQVEYIHYNGKGEKPMAEVPVQYLVESEKNDGPTMIMDSKDFYLPTIMGIWAAGLASMVAYAALSWYRIRLQVRESIPLDAENRKKIFLCDSIPSPFILGVLKPKIYLPSSLDAQQQCSVIAHERAHIARLDHWWKPLGYLLLSVHWFNPMVWVAYALLCRDIEMACDEKVIEKMTPAQKQEYSMVLLTCSMPRKAITACPLAFGESGVKERVRGILKYKKPTFWVIAISVLLCLALAVGFLSNPLRTEDYIKFKGASAKQDMSHTYDFQMRTGRIVKGPILFAELWQNGELAQSAFIPVPESVHDLTLTLTNERDLSGCRVQITAEPDVCNLDVTIPLPEGITLLDDYSWHGPKDISPKIDQEILLAAHIFGRDGFFAFDFDNQDFGEKGGSLRNQECALLVYAVFQAHDMLPAQEQPTASDEEGSSASDGYWKTLRQAGLLHEDDGKELFYESVPRDVVGNVTQEELDQWSGFWYESADLLGDGSAIYKMTRHQHEINLEDVTQQLERICRNIPESAAFGEAIDSIAHTPDYSAFAITLSSGRMIGFDAEELNEQIRIPAQRYSLYTTGQIDSPISIRYQDADGNSAEQEPPFYQLRIGADEVSTITVYYGRDTTIYHRALDLKYHTGDIKTLYCLQGLTSLEGVQILAKDADDHILWQHTFTGAEAFPWEDNGWQLVSWMD